MYIISEKMDKQYFLDLEPGELDKYTADIRQSKYRAKQILKWVYKERIKTFSECSDLSKQLRKILDKQFYLRSLTIKTKQISKLDGTVRYIFQTNNGDNIITVFLPQENRNSICLSTQIGCSIGCNFCASGQMKFVRNLTRGEIIEQIFQVEKDSCQKIDSILFMGMGEPLLNYENVISSIRTLTDTNLLSYSRRHIIVSTAGFVPQIQKLSKEKLGIRLALSLHSPDDDIRKQLISEKVPYTVKEILKTGLEYGRINKSRLTIEYVLIAGINDSISLAQKLAELIKKLSKPKDRIQINLIPYNYIGSTNNKSPDIETVQKFKDLLMRNGLLTIIRQSKGADIGAACGQLIV